MIACEQLSSDKPVNDHILLDWFRIDDFNNTSDDLISMLLERLQSCTMFYLCAVVCKYMELLCSRRSCSWVLSYFTCVDLYNQILVESHIEADSERVLTIEGDPVYRDTEVCPHRVQFQISGLQEKPNFVQQHLAQTLETCT